MNRQAETFIARHRSPMPTDQAAARTGPFQQIPSQNGGHPAHACPRTRTGRASRDAIENNGPSLIVTHGSYTQHPRFRACLHQVIKHEEQSNGFSTAHRPKRWWHG